MKITRTEETSGTWLQGSVLTTRAKLTNAFGEPTQYENDGKVTIEWGIKFEDGTIATIYDWKRYELGTPAEDEMITYNIGGYDPKAVTNVINALKPKISRSLFIEGRLWFDKINGNTYFSNRVWIDGKIAFNMSMEYGYEEQYAHRAIEELHKRGYFEGEKVPSVWEIRDEMGINLYKVATYGKKSELFKGGN
jgi:hypothetical protein